ncbi:MAG TPA: amidohydrolase family protein [Planktothrix sp.]
MSRSRGWRGLERRAAEKITEKGQPQDGQRRLLCARWVVPMCGPPLKDAAVLVEGRQIKDVLFKDQVAEKYSGAQASSLLRNAYDYGDAVILPGLINLHTHLDYSSMRSFDVESGMFTWIRGLVGKASSWTPEQWRQSALHGVRQAALSGTTMVVDSSYTGLSIKALARVGLRAFVGLELFGLKDEESNLAWGQWLAKMDVLRNQDEGEARVALGTGKIRLTVAPHAPYTVCPTLWLKAATWATEKDLPLLAHVAESREECAWIAKGNDVVDEFLGFVRKTKDPAKIPDMTDSSEQNKIKWKGRGLSPVRHLKHFGLLDDHLLAAHAVHLDEGDISLLAECKSKVAHCPRSNARLRNGCAPLSQLLAAGVQVGLGTDGLASTDDLSIVHEAQFALNLHRAIDPKFAVDSADMLAAMTIDAANILNMGHLIGTLEPGKLADIAVFGVDMSDLLVSDNPYDLLLHGPSHIVDLFVEGEGIVKDGQLVNA